jgi:uncharacterized protein YyaL (SSP411 family)
MSTNSPENRLAAESSPYLRQHATNPVDWYPWGDEAFERARSTDRPIFLSIGYSACHWCHVMEQESFENTTIAEIMNRHYVSIKVDREERPDLDEIYMTAVQLLTGSGGWPMTVFLLPDLRPFYGGTYFPPDDRYGRPGFPRILESLAAAYRGQRETVEANAARISASLNPARDLAGGGTDPDEQAIDGAFQSYAKAFDQTYGGFGSEPKFPSSMALSLLLRHHRSKGNSPALEMVELTLNRMARGGIYDQIGGGFHRYSVDERWLVPHFEKMLYDNALLSTVYGEAYQATGNRFYLQVVEDVLDYVMREMMQPEGGFYSTQDADSEGVEGKFFVWTPEELNDVLGEPDASVIMRCFDVTSAGNFEDGNSILHLPNGFEDAARAFRLEEGEVEAIAKRARSALFARRQLRRAPFLDEKVITSWNGLMITAMARAYQVSGREEFLSAARRAAEFILERMVEDNRLFHVYKDGQARVAGFQDDYSCFIVGLLDLFESDFDVRWLDAATRWTGYMIERFWDETGGGFYFSEAGQADLIVRTKSMFDNAVPAGNSTALFGLLRLSALTGDRSLREKAEQTLRTFGRLLRESPTACPHMIGALDLLREPSTEIVIVGDPSEKREMLAAVHQRFMPNKILVTDDVIDTGGSREAIPLLRDKSISGDATVAAFVCRNQTCSAPVATAADLMNLLDQ